MLFVDKTKWHNEVSCGQLHASVYVASCMQNHRCCKLDKNSLVFLYKPK